MNAMIPPAPEREPDIDTAIKPYLHLTDADFAKMKPQVFDLDGTKIGKSGLQLLVRKRQIKTKK